MPAHRLTTRHSATHRLPIATFLPPRAFNPQHLELDIGAFVRPPEHRRSGSWQSARPGPAIGTIETSPKRSPAMCRRKSQSDRAVSHRRGIRLMPDPDHPGRSRGDPGSVVGDRDSCRHRRGTCDRARACTHGPATVVTAACRIDQILCSGSASPAEAVGIHQGHARGWLAGPLALLAGGRRASGACEHEFGPQS